MPAPAPPCLGKTAEALVALGFPSVLGTVLSPPVGWDLWPEGGVWGSPRLYHCHLPPSWAAEVEAVLGMLGVCVGGAWLGASDKAEAFLGPPPASPCLAQIFWVALANCPTRGASVFPPAEWASLGGFPPSLGPRLACQAALSCPRPEAREPWGTKTHYRHKVSFCSRVNQAFQESSASEGLRRL